MSNNNNLVADNTNAVTDSGVNYTAVCQALDNMQRRLIDIIDYMRKYYLCSTDYMLTVRDCASVMLQYGIPQSVIKASAYGGINVKLASNLNRFTWMVEFSNNICADFNNTKLSAIDRCALVIDRLRKYKHDLLNTGMPVFEMNNDDYDNLSLSIMNVDPCTVCCQQKIVSTTVNTATNQVLTTRQPTRRILFT